MAVNAGGEEVSYQSRGKKKSIIGYRGRRIIRLVVHSMAWELITIETQNMVANL